MRESNFSFPVTNRACICVASALYDRRALDCTADLPLINSLTHLVYLTSTSARIREILTMDGGLERLVRVLKTTSGTDKLSTWKWSLAFQCVANIGIRGTEQIRTRVVEAGVVKVLEGVFERFLQMLEVVRAEKERQRVMSLPPVMQLPQAHHPMTQPLHPQHQHQPLPHHQQQQPQPPSQPQQPYQQQYQHQAQQQQQQQQQQLLLQRHRQAALGTLAMRGEEESVVGTLNLRARTRVPTTPTPGHPEATRNAPRDPTIIQPRPDALFEFDLPARTPTAAGPVAEDAFDIPNLTRPTQLHRPLTTRAPAAAVAATQPQPPRSPHMPELVVPDGAQTAPSEEPDDGVRPTFDPDNLVREEDVLLALQLLAYLSKYPHLRAHLWGGLAFTLAERFTPRLHPPEVQYWAGVIMRNACRKDHGGLRRCMSCGKEEKRVREFAKCQRCGKARYCSRDCQFKSWGAGHRWWCVEREAPSSPASSSSSVSSGGSHHSGRVSMGAQANPAVAAVSAAGHPNAQAGGVDVARERGGSQPPFSFATATTANATSAMRASAHAPASRRTGATSTGREGESSTSPGQPPETQRSDRTPRGRRV
ncbi:uncharacterized protein VTP21DRAFT_876 [Calcarisporiella thermophila]|uniref:uncharacterized protein n=1 Tax=Calcarisporiella thermophila TaxID=911321 RepID=UPI003742EE67